MDHRYADESADEINKIISANHILHTKYIKRMSLEERFRLQRLCENPTEHYEKDGKNTRKKKVAWVISDSN